MTDVIYGKLSQLELQVERSLKGSLEELQRGHGSFTLSILAYNKGKKGNLRTISDHFQLDFPIFFLQIITVKPK